MTFVLPVFWYNQGPRAHRLADARRNAKGKTVLRKIRAGYATISPQRTASPSPTLPEFQSEPEPEPLAGMGGPSEEQHFPSPPDYESIDPPPYAHPLPSALPRYTLLPDVVFEPSRDELTQPIEAQRRRYRDVLRRRLTTTRQIFSEDHRHAQSLQTDCMCETDGDTARGTGFVREGDHWVGTMDPLQQKGDTSPSQRGFRRWLRRIYKHFMEPSGEHPHLPYCLLL